MLSLRADVAGALVAGSSLWMTDGGSFEDIEDVDRDDVRGIDADRRRRAVLVLRVEEAEGGRLTVVTRRCSPDVYADRGRRRRDAVVAGVTVSSCTILDNDDALRSNAGISRPDG